jgi:hypothetical protein
MSALGHKRKWCHARVMSVLSLKADIRQREWNVRFVPLADIGAVRRTSDPDLDTRRTVASAAFRQCHRMRMPTAAS